MGFSASWMMFLSRPCAQCISAESKGKRSQKVKGRNHTIFPKAAYKPYCRLFDICSKSHWLLTFVSMSHEDQPLTIPGIRRVPLGLLCSVFFLFKRLDTVYTTPFYSHIFPIILPIYLRFNAQHKKKTWSSHDANTSGLTPMPHRTNWRRCGLLGTSDFRVFGTIKQRHFHKWTMEIYVCNGLYVWNHWSWWVVTALSILIGPHLPKVMF